MNSTPSRPARLPVRSQGRRAVALLPCLVAGSVLLAAPAHADVPVGWSDPADVSAIQFLLVLVVFPLVLVAVISLLTLLPGMIRGEGILGRSAHHDDQWFGGRRSGTELGEGDQEKSRAITGGGSGTW